MNKAHFFIEAESAQLCKAGQSVCGDSIESRRIKGEERLITVLSDGLGSGVKANVLATMTTSMALQFSSRNTQVDRIARFIMNTLPVDATRKMSYSTFTILDINCLGEVTVVEYDNPTVFVCRNGQCINLRENSKAIQVDGTRQVFVRHSSFKLEKEDRLVAVSDGVTQAGMGRKNFPFGWELPAFQEYVLNVLEHNPLVSAAQLSRMIVQRAANIDMGQPADDITCHVVYCRNPRLMMLVSGPPYHQAYDRMMAQKLQFFKGRKVICGGTTTKIISREWKCEVGMSLSGTDHHLPPEASMEGVDLITEGILTLGRVASLLESLKIGDLMARDPAEKLVKMLLDCDEIHILAGTRINQAHQDPALPVELEIRRNVIKKIASILEEKFLKTVYIEYL
ncbi:MAG: SpoIIE family protein phosphatase [Breznakibacter sp.]